MTTVDISASLRAMEQRVKAAAARKEAEQLEIVRLEMEAVRKNQAMDSEPAMWSEADIKRLQDEMCRIQRRNQELEAELAETAKARNLAKRRLKHLDELVKFMKDSKVEFQELIDKFGKLEAGSQKIWDDVFDRVDEADMMMQEWDDEVVM